ncbi:MAG: tetratricopeptide repeat protein [bacterium]|nr:tetratricopeptide repeat protein [bacterium]
MSGNRPEQTNSPRPVWPLALIFLLALAVRAVYFAELRGSPFFAVLLGDAYRYDAWAREIVAGDWIGSQVFYQAPLYPYLLALVYKLAGPSAGIVRLAQALGGATACVLLALVGKRLFAPRVGWLAGIMLALYPPAVFFDGLLQKASAGLLFLTALLYLLSGIENGRRASWLVAGLTMGGLILLRENAMLLLPVIGLWLIVESRGNGIAALGRRAALFTLGVALFLVPVGLRNRAVGGTFLITTSQAGSNFFIGNSLEANGRYRPLRPQGGDARVERFDARELAEADTGRELTAEEVSDYWFGRALADIRSDPGHWLRLMLQKSLLLWNAREIVDTDSIEAYGDSSSLLATLAAVWHFGVLAPLALSGLWLTRGRWRSLWLLYGMLLAMAVSVVLFYVVARYRYPMTPLLMLFAAAAVFETWELVKRRKLSALRPVAAVLLIAAVITNWPLAAAAGIDSRATNYLNLGITLSAEGDPRAAIPQLERAISLAGDFAPARRQLGRALVRTGRTADAIPQFERALEIEPGDAEAHNQLGYLLTQAGRLDEGVRHLREAVEIDPDLAFAHNQLANVAASRGQLEEAEAAYRRALESDPDLADARYKLGQLLSTRDDAEAVIHLAAAARLLPDFAGAHYSLGAALERRTRFLEAAKAYRRVLVLDPGHEEAAAGLERLLASGDSDNNTSPVRD